MLKMSLSQRIAVIVIAAVTVLLIGTGAYGLVARGGAAGVAARGGVACGGVLLLIWRQALEVGEAGSPFCCAFRQLQAGWWPRQRRQ